MVDVKLSQIGFLQTNPEFGLTVPWTSKEAAGDKRIQSCGLRRELLGPSQLTSAQLIRAGDKGRQRQMGLSKCVEKQGKQGRNRANKTNHWASSLAGFNTKQKSLPALMMYDEEPDTVWFQH